MKTNSQQLNARGVFFALLSLCLLFFAGCKEEIQKFVWSPDGSRAAIVTPDGLRFCDADGKLAPEVIPGVYRMAWLNDAQHLVVVRKHDVKTWDAVVAEFGKPRAESVAAHAEGIWQSLRAVVQTKDTLDSSFERLLKDEAEGSTILFYFLTHHTPAEIKFATAEDAQKWEKDWNEPKDIELEIHEVITAQIQGDHFSLGVSLDKIGELESSGSLNELRPSPDGKAVAWTREFAFGDGSQKIWMALSDKPGATLVASNAAAFPDWTPDGRTLVYFQASGTGDNSNLRLGALVRRVVLNAEGKIDLKDEENLVGVIFNKSARVRCLKDQRVIFNAPEIALPIANSDIGGGHEQLFALMPNAPTLMRLTARKSESGLPALLSSFEVSPDNEFVVFGSSEGQISLLTLATGNVEKISVGKEANITALPAWRKPAELTIFRTNTDRQSARLGEVVLKSGKVEKILSKDWPENVVNSFFSRDSKKEGEGEAGKK